MSVDYGPIDIDCDALPYPLVQACETLNFRSPLDVRWCRMSQFGNGQGEGSGLFSSQSWKRLFRKNQGREKACTCGDPLPTLEQYAFTFSSGAHVEYYLGQCGRCGTMFWEQATASSFAL
jgi:hypothetical protein